MDLSFRHLFDFRSRATRREYLVVNLLLVLAFGLPYLLTILVVGGSDDAPRAIIQALLWVCIALWIAGAVAMWAVSVRRLHDHGKPWFFLLFNLVPFVGWLIGLYLVLKPGDPDENEYGPNPRLAGAGLRAA